MPRHHQPLELSSCFCPRVTISTFESTRKSESFCPEMISHPRSPRRTHDVVPTASESQTVVKPRRCPSHGDHPLSSGREPCDNQPCWTTGFAPATSSRPPVGPRARNRQVPMHASSHPDRAARRASIYNVSRHGYDFSGGRITDARSAYARYIAVLRQRDRRAEPPTTVLS